jgi:hypothetical protein
MVISPAPKPAPGRMDVTAPQFPWKLVASRVQEVLADLHRYALTGRSSRARFDVFEMAGRTDEFRSLLAKSESYWDLYKLAGYGIPCVERSGALWWRHQSRHGAVVGLKLRRGNSGGVDLGIRARRLTVCPPLSPLAEWVGAAGAHHEHRITEYLLSPPNLYPDVEILKASYYSTEAQVPKLPHWPSVFVLYKVHQVPVSAHWVSHGEGDRRLLRRTGSTGTRCRSMKQWFSARFMG